MNLLEIGKIVRAHGIKGAVKIISYIDENFSTIKHVYLTRNFNSAYVTQAKSLNGDAYAITLDIVKDVESAEKLKNQSVYIDRDEYKQFKDKIYLSDLTGLPVISETGEKLGELADFDDYGASVVLTIRCGSVSYQLPFVDEIINYNDDLKAFVVEKQKFEDMKV